MPYLPTFIRDIAVAVLAILLGLNVWLANGNPLFYFDTVGYLIQGGAAFDLLPSFLSEGGLPGDQAMPADPDGRVVGSRSLGYSLLLFASAKLGALGFIPVLQLAIVVVTFWLTIRVMSRAAGVVAPQLPTLAAVIGAGCVTSLPFYVAFLMPDILTSMLLVVISVLVAGAGHMRRWEFAALCLIGVVATLSHASHIAIAGLMAAIVLVIILFQPNTRRRAGITLVSVIAVFFVVGVAERLVFGAAVRLADRGEVYYLPYLSARLISDGPGLDWLAENCDDETGLATCAIYPALRDSEKKLTGARILFDRSERFGSFARLDQQTQNDISREQLSFATKVVLSRPGEVFGLFIGNIGQQLRLNKVTMTLLNPSVAAKVGPQIEVFEPGISDQALRPSSQWIKNISIAHQLVYAASAMGIAVFLVAFRNNVPVPLRRFAWLVLLGILANAVVCGAGAIPADRYGARVAYLLPCLFILLWVFVRRKSARPVDQTT